MYLLTDKYGDAKSLKRALFDLVRAKAELLQPEKYPTFIDDIEVIIKLQGDNPSNSDIQFLLGQLYEASPGKSTEACIAFLTGMLTCDENEVPFFLNEVNKNLIQKNAKIVFSRVREGLLENLTNKIKDTAHIELFAAFLGKLYLYSGRYNTAIEYFKQVTGTSANRIQAIEGIGQAYLLSGKPKEAIDHFLKVKDSSVSGDRKTEVSFMLIAAMIENNDLDRAIVEIRQTKAEAPAITDQIQLNTLLSQCNYEKKEFQSGLFTIDEVLESIALLRSGSNDFFVQAVCVKAKLLIALHGYTKALEILEDALFLEQRHTELIFLKAQVFFEGQFQIEEAKNLIGFLENIEMDFESKIKKILEVRGDDGNAYLFAAYCDFLVNDKNEKIGAYVEKAESLGLKNENEYPKIGLYLLRGEIAEKTGKKEEASTPFFEAAKCYYWMNNFAEANKYFERSVSFTPSPNEAHIYYADTLFILSSQNTPPYNNSDLLSKAYNAWHRAPGKLVTIKYDAWHYIVIARIHEMRYKFSERNYYEEHWQSILYVERALVHSGEDISLWIYLGRFYRNLELESNGLSAFEKAESLNANDGFLKEEKLILQLNMGDYEKPLEFIEDLKQKEQSTPQVYNWYYKSWEGYVFFNNYKDYLKALRLFDEAILEVNSNLFLHQMKTACHWHLHQFEEAKKEANEIISLGNRYTYLKEEFTFAWAYFTLGQTEKAINILETFNERGNTNTDNLFGLSQFYLYTGQKDKAQAAFNNFMRWTYNKRIFYEFIQSLDALEFQFNDEKADSQEWLVDFKQIIESWKEQINNKLQNITFLSAEAEFKSTLEEYKYKAGSVPFVAVQAGFARIARYAKNFPEAYRVYNSLKDDEAIFPEVKTALNQIEEEVFSVVRLNIKDSQFIEAIEYLMKFDMDEAVKAIIKYTLLSLAYFGSNNEEKSLENLQLCFKLAGTDTELQKKVWEEITVNAYSPKLTWDFGNLLTIHVGKYIDEKDSSEPIDFLLKNFWNLMINKNNFFYPIVTPVTVEISKDLVSPASGSTDWYVIKKLIPALREKIFQAYGIKPSAVRIRLNEGDLASGTYIIMLDEVPFVMGTVQKDKLFVIKSETPLKELGIAGESSPHPFSGEDAYWVSAEYKNLLNDNSISYREDFFDYIIAHLEAVLVRNLDMFVDNQLCDDYLEIDANNKDLDNAKLLTKNANAIRTKPPLLVLFNQIVKGLLREKVPIINKDVILKSFLAGKDTCKDIAELIQYIRLRLKKDLPVNNMQITTIELPTETEQHISEELRNEQGKTFLAMTPENCQEALADIKSIIAKDAMPGNKMLLTKSPQLRIHLRRLVELEFPNLLVASPEELI